MTPSGPIPSSSRLSRVLIAEDNKLNGLLIAEQLLALELSPEVVNNGLIALERWRREAFSAVITDINMPDMDGYQLAASIRAEEPVGVHMPIIALTANAFIDKSSRWQLAGIDALLTKPIELSMLKSILDRWLAPQRPTPGPDAQKSIVASSEPIDPDALARVVGHDPAVVARFMASFAQAAEQAAARMEVAMADRGGRVEVGRLAHQLKASAAAVGAQPLARLCEGIESAVLAEDEVALAAVWRLLPDEVRRVNDRIAAQAVRGTAHR